MEISVSSCDNAEEDYIDMEVSSTSFNSTSHPREFEFQMNSNSIEAEPTTSPADELFYKGNLLPLHLPPRLEMVQKLLQNQNSSNLTTTDTPFDSCINSPISYSCRVSGEMNSESDEVYYECYTEEKKTWSEKLKLMKQSSFSVKLKASKAYFKALFTKPYSSEEGEGAMSKAKELLNKYMKIARRNPFGQIRSDRGQVAAKNLVEENISNRRSFSLSMKKHSRAKSTSSSSSLSLSSTTSSSSSSSSSGVNEEVDKLKRSGSSNSDTESSIEGAIAYCKKSGKCGLWEKSDT